MEEIILIIYTTLYRKGGDRFKRVAETMGREKELQGNKVICKSVESKIEIKELFHQIETENQKIAELHFIGHSGMYGPMFGTIQYPEQFSPHELRQLSIPFIDNAVATFHCCRSARWFAPFFSRVHGVKTSGYHWYTTFSTKKDQFKLPMFLKDSEPLYCFGCPGKKSHGLGASLKKMAGLMKAEPLKEFSEQVSIVDNSYDGVAQLYADTFSDIKVRKDEYKWIMKHLPSNKSIILEIGCGNGSLLKELQQNDKILSATGVDVSEPLLEYARDSNANCNNISFTKIDGPELPFDNASFDIVISMLSFRYLDWDPMLPEIERVLHPKGKLLIVDMVTAPVRWFEFPMFLLSKTSNYLDRLRFPVFYANLKKLVSHPDWKRMLHYNPIRSQHEMKWYLESRFPGRKVEIINIGLHSRILAFDSQNMTNIQNLKLSYP